MGGFADSEIPPLFRILHCVNGPRRQFDSGNGTAPILFFFKYGFLCVVSNLTTKLTTTLTTR